MLNTLKSIITFLFLFLLPLFFLPITSDPYDYNKMILLILFSTLLLLLAAVRLVQTKTFRMSLPVFGLPMILLGIASVASTLFQSPNVAMSLTAPLGTATIIAAVMVYFLLTDSGLANNLHGLTNTIIVSGVIASLFIIVMYIGLLPASVATPVGNLLTTATFLVPVLVFTISQLIHTLFFKKTQDYIQSKWIIPFYAGSALTIAAGCTFLMLHLTTDHKPIWLPYPFGITIAFEVMSSAKTFLLGIGPANFITAFSLGKPVSINTTPYWNILFTSSSSFFLTTLTELGILAVISFVWIVLLVVYRLFRRKGIPIGIILTTLVCILLLFALPGNVPLLVLTAVFLAFETGTAGPIKTLHLSRIISVIISTTVVFFVICVWYFAGRAYTAEVLYTRSLQAINKNQGTEAYNLQKQAIDLNPYIDRYHGIFSKTSLSLANALAGKKELSDEEKQLIPRLVQQAIEEAKQAVNLHPTHPANWDILITIYTVLVNFAQGSDTWAMDSYRQKIAIDPTSPSTRMSYGALLMSLQKYKEAEEQFKEAVRLKSDLTAGHLQLAIALRDQGKYTEAYQSSVQAASLIPPDSPDNQVIQQQLEILATKEASATSNANQK